MERIKSTLGLGAAVAIAVGCVASQAIAVPITGTYDVTFAVSTNGSTLSDGPTSTTVGSPVSASIDIPPMPFTFADFSSDLMSDGTLEVSMLATNALNFGYPTDVSIMLTAVSLADAGVAGPIVDVAFDAARTDLGQYADAADFDGPTVSFTGDSITIAFAYDGPGIAADGPFLYFDVKTGSSPAAIPEPGAALLFGSALWMVRGAGRKRD